MAFSDLFPFHACEEVKIPAQELAVQSENALSGQGKEMQRIVDAVVHSSDQGH